MKVVKVRNLPVEVRNQIVADVRDDSQTPSMRHLLERRPRAKLLRQAFGPFPTFREKSAFNTTS